MRYIFGIILFFKCTILLAQNHTLKFENNFAYGQELTNMFGDYENISNRVSYSYKLLYFDFGLEKISFNDVAKIISSNVNQEYKTLGNEYQLGFLQISPGLNIKLLKYVTYQSGISLAFLINKSFRRNPKINLQTGLIDGIQFDPNGIQVLNSNGINPKTNINDFRGSIFQRIVFNFNVYKNLELSTHFEFVSPFTNLTYDDFLLPNYFDKNHIKENYLYKFGFGIAYSF